MRLVNILFKISFIIFVLGYLSKVYFIPEYAVYIYKSDYMNLTIKCAHAMDSNWYIEQQDNPALKKSSELQLIDCHDYDKLRKHMLESGVSEYRLSELGLVSLEIHQRPASELAQYHKFRER